MKNFVSICDLVLDIYLDRSYELLGYYPGGSAWNDLYNIKRLNNSINCSVVGTCGDDWAGNFIKDISSSYGIDVNYVRSIPKQTKRFSIIVDADQTKSQLKCPLCKETIWYSDSIYPQEIPEQFKKTEGIVIIDSLKKSVLGLAKAFHQEGWYITADIGYINHLRYMSNENIEAIFSHTFDFLQTNTRVCKFLLNKFGFLNESGLFNFLGCKYLNITDGPHGSRFFYRNLIGEIKVIDNKPIPVENIDPTGAGDAYFSTLLLSLNNNCGFDGDVTAILKSADAFAAERVSVVGANGRYEKVVIPSGDCKICGSAIKSKVLKKTRPQKIAINANNLLDRTLRALESDAKQRLKDVLCTVHNQILMVGTGGSYVAANFTAKIINKYHNDAYAIPCKPRDVVVNGLRKVDAVFLFSYSGKTKDIQIVYELCKKNKIPVYIITKLDPKISKGLFDERSVISYNSSKTNSKERGFLSMAGTLIPMCLFAELFFDNDTISFRDFLRFCFEKRIIEFSKEQYFFRLPNQKICIDIFSGADTSSAAIDLESKFIESGLGRVVIHEKKDFSHGRFNIIEKFSPDLIIFLQNETGAYSNKLFQYLERRENLYIYSLKSDCGNIWGDLDLVVASQFLLKYISKASDYDMATPDYPEDAMTLYKFSRKELL